MQVRGACLVFATLILLTACGPVPEMPAEPTSTVPTVEASATVVETPTASVVPRQTQVPSPVPGVVPARFGTLPPGSALPTGDECSARVRRTLIERRPENAEANRTVPQPLPITIDGASKPFNAMWASRIDGRFTGTTDEIIQWAACKWGFDEDLMRARAVEESSWRQSTLGDPTSDRALCALISLPTPCAQSYGLFQVKVTIHTGTYPQAMQSTAFNADYSSAWLRACFEGDFKWLGRSYRTGDLDHCVGAWFSGEWRDDAAQEYLNSIYGHIAQRTWDAPGF